MLNVHVITQNEPFYIPKMIDYIMCHSKSVNFVSFTVLKPTRKSKSIWFWIKERLKIYSVYETILVFIAFIITKCINILLRSKSPYSVKNKFKKYNIEEINTTDINNPDYITKLGEKSLDLIISISCPQLFKSEILKVPDRYCLNAHGTLLPRHRGVFGSWWTLFCGDNEAGSTIHTMELKLDAGEILWQQSFPIPKGSTQYSIAYRTKKEMAMGFTELFEEIENHMEKPIENNYKSSYHYAPTKQEGKNFHKLGHRIIKLKDISYMLASKY